MTVGARAVFSPPSVGFGTISKLFFALFLVLSGMAGVLQSTASAQADVEALGYATEVISFAPGEYIETAACTISPPIPNNQNGTASGALGAPDYGTGSSSNTIASLGNGGVIVLQMGTPFGGSGDAENDIFVWEQGAGEGYRVEVSADLTSWTNIGEIGPGNPGEQGFDVDAYGFDEFDQLLYVRITDLEHENHGCNPNSQFSFTGSDIDAVGVLTRPIYADIAIEKSSVVEDGAELVEGGTVTYTFTVTNTGTVDLTDVIVTDEMTGLSDITPASADIAVGDDFEFTATYEVTQADIDAGEIDNTASVTGTPPEDCTECETPTDDDDLITELTQNPALSIEKVSDVGDGTTVGLGDEIVYTFTVTNTGNVTIADVTIDDPMEGLAWIDDPNVGTLAPEADAVVTASYIVTEADILAEGGIENSATANGNPPGDTPPVESPPDTVIVPPVDPNPAMTVTKVPSTEGPVAFGETITYTFTATNTGNVTLSDVSIIDPLEGLSPIEPASVATLAPGATAEFSATYVVTEADVFNGSVVNNATGTGEPPADCIDCETTITPPPPVTVIIEEPDPALTVAKVANTEGPAELNEIITYTFTATNTGNVTLSNVSIIDPLEGLSPIEPESVATLAPGASAEFTATYQVTEADVLAGEVVNNATGTGEPPADCIDCETTITPPPPVTVIIEEPDPAMTVTKVPSTDGPAAAGETITYTFTATNTGNVTLFNVSIIDPLEGLSPIEPESVATLAPGASAEFSATYVVSEADVLNGSVVNTATGTGEPPADCIDCETTITPPPPVTVVTEDPDPAMVVTKQASTEGPVAFGETITYAFTATNTGNITLYNVGIIDPLEGLSPIEPGSVESLVPGATAEFSATYVVTEADVLTGSVTNSATGIGEPPAGCEDCETTITPPPPVTVITEDPAPGLALVKTANSAGPVVEGETITYTFSATNTGNVTLTDVTIADGIEGLTWVNGPNLGAIAPGVTVEGSATYVVTQADVLAGGVFNSATGTGTPPEGFTPPETPPSEVNIPTEDPATGLTLVKSADPASGVQVGDTITYTFTATNIGNMPLTDVTITDELPGLEWVTGPNIGAIAPGESATGSATYVVTQADVNAGGVTNSATATGTPPGDLVPPTSPPSEVTVPIESTSGLNMVKSVSPDTTINAGETLTYTFVVTNTGATTIDNVTVTDPLPGLSEIDGPHGTSLEPGESATFTATYVVTDLDVVAGMVMNTATGSGTGTDGGELSSVDSVAIRACAAPESEIDAPVGTPSVENESETDNPVDDAPATPPAVEEPVEEVPTEEAPVEEVPTEEAPVDEVPTEEAPVDEAPTEEAPVDEVPTEEAPVDEVPTEEAPIDEAPVDNEPTNEGDDAGEANQVTVFGFQQLADCEPLPVDPGPDPDPAPQQPTRPGTSAPPVTSLPSTGQGASDSGMSTTAIALVATGLGLVLAAGTLAIRRDRVS